MSVSVTLALLFCLGAVASDLKGQVVDNLWILLGWSAGAVCGIVRGGAVGAGAFLVGAALPIAALWILFLFRVLGAGDIKTLSVAGGLLGARAGLAIVFWAFVLGAALSLAILKIEGSLVRRFGYFFRFVRRSVITRQRTVYRRGATARTELHFTVPILMSAMLVTGGVLA